MTPRLLPKHSAKAYRKPYRKAYSNGTTSDMPSGMASRGEQFLEQYTRAKEETFQERFGTVAQPFGAPSEALASTVLAPCLHPARTCHASVTLMRYASVTGRYIALHRHAPSEKELT